MIRIAIVEDNPDLLDEVSFVLRHEHFQVTPCLDGQAFDVALQQDSFDVVVLDVGLPGEDGFSIARRIRQAHPATGIILMTARGDIADRIQGMQEGADAYLTKPVDLRELALVIRAISRRLLHTAESTQGLNLFLLDQVLQLEGGERLALTRSESLLLSRLSRSPGQQATRQQLIEALGYRYADYDPRRLEAIISRLRKKLTQAGLEEGVIRVVRQTGYAFSYPLLERERMEF